MNGNGDDGIVVFKYYGFNICGKERRSKVNGHENECQLTIAATTKVALLANSNLNSLRSTLSNRLGTLSDGAYPFSVEFEKHCKTSAGENYRRSSSPEVKAKGVEVARRMIEQFDNLYGNGVTFNVHVFNNLTYRVIFANTADACCIFNCLELDSDEVNAEGQYQLITEEEDSSGGKRIKISKVRLLEEKILKREDLQRLV
ncbi:hypothetical protein DFH28DRAFT_926335 [Melampsora americana]|nr:hypothetical protein DFH28DRAFT_926335 [Melampsora americana]